MRKIMILLGMVVLLIGCKSSKSQPAVDNYRNLYTEEVLDGIFELRIGMSEAELRAVVDTTQLKHSNSIDYLEEHLGDRMKRFRLNEYIPSTHYAIESINLSFFDDKLYAIIVHKYDSKLKYLLTQKYGDPQKKESKEKKKGEYKEKTPEVLRKGLYDEYTTVKYTYTDKYHWITWPTNSPNITCHYAGRELNDLSLYIEDTYISKQMQKEYWEKDRKERDEELEKLYQEEEELKNRL